jgi:hypothetical protein
MLQMQTHHHLCQPTRWNYFNLKLKWTMSKRKEEKKDGGRAKTILCCYEIIWNI